VVEHFTHNSEIKGSNPAAGTGRVKITQNFVNTALYRHPNLASKVKTKGNYWAFNCLKLNPQAIDVKRLTNILNDQL
jgi:hypothetical protein